MTVLENKIHTGLEQSIQDLGKKLWEEIKEETPGIFNKNYWQGRILEWAMKDPDFKVDLFRFVDVLPMLQSPQQISEHIREYLVKEGRDLPGVMNMALKAASSDFTSGLASKTIKKNLTDLAERFILAHDPQHALTLLSKMHHDGLGFSVDLLGEVTVSHEEAEIYQNRYKELIQTLSDEVNQWQEDEIIDRNHLGSLPRGNISLKISAMDPLLDPIDIEGSVKRLKEKILPLFLLAKEKNVFINMDLEQWSLHDITYGLFEEIIHHPDLRNWPHIGIVVQAYLHSAQKDLDRLIQLAKNRGMPITVRLVKGAYWDFEIVQSGQYGYPCPVFLNKSTSDANFESLTGIMLDNLEYILPAFGSHNLRSLINAITLADEKNIPKEACEIQMLYGMAEPERKVFRMNGHRVRIYSPIGELLPGISYLVRRLLENTANQGFLRLSHYENMDSDTLLKKPVPGKEAGIPSRMKSGELNTPFENSPHSDFTDKNIRLKFSNAINNIKIRFPLDIPIVINGNILNSDDISIRYSPSHKELLVSKISKATLADAEDAIQKSYKAYPGWRDKPVEERALLLDKLADLLESDRYELTALQIFEEGKPWREADADVAEAIDFCRYYARQALKELTPQKQGNLPGEDNIFFYEGRGPTVIIAPWNFPLAILTGMTAAALVAGNPVIMKPSLLSSAIAYALYEKMEKAGFPSGIVQFLPGMGKEIGNYLVEHPLTAQIAFTGSKEVGLFIIEKAAVTKSNQPQVKRIVCEMGGKNAIIIDDDAELDEAVTGVIKSTFGYAGQKCSACSRLILVGEIYNPFIRRMIEACRTMVVAPADDPACGLGPVIDEKSHNRLMNIINNPGNGAREIFRGKSLDNGFYVPPVIFEVEDINHPLMQNELFGPVLTVYRVDDFQKALEVALSSEFALTGSVYSRSPHNLQLARQKFRVGNLYLNHVSTGAFVDRQPFGGFGMSGIGTKAGGPGYLLNFAQPRTITENTTRRGFTPDIESI